MRLRADHPQLPNIGEADPWGTKMVSLKEDAWPGAIKRQRTFSDIVGQGGPLHLFKTTAIQVSVPSSLLFQLS